MGYWCAGIYGNDIAMDCICGLDRLINNTYNINNIKEAIKMYKREYDYNYKYEECKLALAYVELNLTGKVSNVKTILNIIDKELRDKNIKEWDEDCREERKQILNKFKNEIENNNIEIVKDINQWFMEIHDQDILLNF
jgi:hypothetical protein